MTWFGLVVCALAAYRLTRIVTTDTITDQLRDRLYRWAWVEPGDGAAYDVAVERWPAPEWKQLADNGAALPRGGAWRTYVNELFNCPWCFGVWCSFAVVAAWSWLVLDGISIVRYLLTAAAVAGAQGFLASRQDA